MDDENIRDINSAFASPTFGKDGSFELDKPVGSMSISPCGRDVVLASRQGLHIIDLDSPWKPPRHLPHHTPWEVADVQWSPFPSRDYWVVSTSNQRALVWNLAATNARSSIEHYLHAHTRAITDINFSAHHPDVLATCAVDSFVHCWDLRQPRRPAVSFADWFGGATQVKWNRQDSHIIASSHDRFLRIWDDRQGAKPLCSINAHATKIYGIDWNRTRETAIVTCSLDRTIKYWDYQSSTEEPERVRHTPYPVWRARHTPFGCGLLAMPQRGDNNLHLYNRSSDQDSPDVQIFEGHQDQVKEFLWRFRGGIEAGVDNREFQLVTWGADRVLRLHCMDEETLAGVGYERGKPVDGKYNLTRKNATYRTFRDPSKTPTDPHRSALTDLLSSGAAEGTNRPSASPAAFAVGGWVTNGFLSARHGLQTKSQLQQDLDPISWMKGVKIGKKEAGLEESTGSLIAPHSRVEKIWEDFDSLGEEITHVGSKFSKVKFYDVDVQKRYVKISMDGLWGSNETSVYLNCRLDFPAAYPSGATPTLDIEKTALLDNATISRLQTGVKEIAEAYLDFQRSSLEALIRYLQGDQTVNDALAWTRVQEIGIVDFGAAGDSSSDEEDELGELADAHIDDLGFKTSNQRLLSSANAHVPLPNGCGAVWAKNGSLVCFFPPKLETASSLVGSLGLDGSAVLPTGKAKYFEGFGKMHRHPKTKSRNSSLGTTEDSDSESDSSTSDSSFSSTRSSASSRNASSKGHQQGSKHSHRADFHFLSRFDGLSDDFPISNGTASVARSGTLPPKSLVSIHDLQDLLSAKKSLAERYAVCGPEACIRNAEVALNQGYEDLSGVWLLLDSLVKSCGPDEQVGTAYNTLRRHDDGVDRSRTYDRDAQPSRPVSWGHHPFGDAGVILRLFEYYVSTGDIQMLTMMSCILSEAESMSQAYAHERQASGTSQGKSNSKSSQDTSSLRRASYHQGHYATVEATPSFHAAERIDSSSASSPTKLRHALSSQSSSFGNANGDPGMHITKSLTPPNFFKANQHSTDGTTTMISTSPERMRHPQRSSSNLASAFAASLPRALTFNTSNSISPPKPPFFTKKPSPVGSLSTRKGALIREASRSFEKTYENLTVPPTTTAPLRLPSPGEPFSINLKNQDQFPFDGYAHSRLLDPATEPLRQGYRAAYANLLAAWDLPLARAEVLQYHTPPPHPIPSHARNTSTSSTADVALLVPPRTAANNDTPPAGNGALGLVTLCPVCATPQPRGRRARCPGCRARPRPPACAFCDEPVRGLAAPCLACGRVLHLACQTALERAHGEADGPDVGGVCVADGSCGGGALAGAPNDASPSPRRARRAPSMASTIREADVGGDRGGDRAGDRGARTGAAAAPWEDVAYESLAKNLAVGLGVGSAKLGKTKAVAAGGMGRRGSGPKR